MAGDYRKLMCFIIQDLKTGVEEDVFLDSYAIWEDIGNRMLQPTRSTQQVRGLCNLKAGKSIITSGKRWTRVDDNVYRRNTSMNDCRSSQ